MRVVVVVCVLDWSPTRLVVYLVWYIRQHAKVHILLTQAEQHGALKEREIRTACPFIVLLALIGQAKPHDKNVINGVGVTHMRVTGQDCWERDEQ